ncbi:MAG: bifunctional DNA-formamidopyrimidine glycosylase/DNA-(apurinic or apyrimidinic site) lyase [Planctomycetota bacterium]|jgi:formamidopyrimidine-DNA glycosylase|nr:bifunctional DNA-formamidopyrimidine glycosylase/DNA-(apurinic or apyrimidinic site) lyase [Planctomycetota bacterium]
MPELPEVETVVRALDQALAGRVFVAARELGRVRLPFSQEETKRLVLGRRIVGVRRRAKYIVIECAAAGGLLAHLGMTGSFRLEKPGVEVGKHDRIVLTLADGEELRYADPRRFGFLKPVGLEGQERWPPELARLGPEPLDPAFRASVLEARAVGRRTPVKTFIMDQATVVGVGNIYASEALFRSRIDPRRLAKDLSSAEWRRLVAAIRKILRQAIQSGGSSIRNYRRVDGREGGFQRSLQVYGRGGESCPACDGEVEIIRQGGRSTFFCPRCQV